MATKMKSSDRLDKNSIDIENNKTYLQKFENVDIAKALKAIANQKIIHYPIDIDFDIEAILEYVNGNDAEKKMLLWHVSEYGTHSLAERNSFIWNTGEFNCWVNHTQPDMLGYVIEIKGNEDGKIFGNVYELDHKAHIEHVRETALPAQTVTIHYANKDDKTISIQDYDEKRNYFMSENGWVTDIRFTPENESELDVILAHESNQRKQTPVGNFKEHIESLIDARINKEAERICSRINTLSEPNSPDKALFMVRLSDEFTSLASSKDQSRLFDILPYEDKAFSQIKGKKGIFVMLENKEVMKPSIKKKILDAEKEVNKHQKKISEKSKKTDREEL